MTCSHTLAGGPLLCTRPVDHRGGHVYVSTSGVAGCRKEE